MYVRSVSVKKARLVINTKELLKEERCCNFFIPGVLCKVPRAYNSENNNQFQSFFDLYNLCTSVNINLTENGVKFIILKRKFFCKCIELVHGLSKNV